MLRKLMKINYYFSFVVAKSYTPHINAINKIAILNKRISLSTTIKKDADVRITPTGNFPESLKEFALQISIFITNKMRRTFSILSPFYQHGVYGIKTGDFRIVLNHSQVLES